MIRFTRIVAYEPLPSSNAIFSACLPACRSSAKQRELEVLGRHQGQASPLGKEDVLQVANSQIVPGELKRFKDLRDQGAKRIAGKSASGPRAGAGATPPGRLRCRGLRSRGKSQDRNLHVDHHALVGLCIVLDPA